MGRRDDDVKFSSYDKIARHLAGCPDGKKYVQGVVDALGKATVSDFSFALVKPEGKPVEASPRFTIDIVVGEIQARFLDDGVLDTVSIWSFVNEFALKPILRANWKTKHCPSYNCKRGNVMHGGANSIGFESHMRDVIREKISTAPEGERPPLDLMNERLNRQAHEIVASEEWKKARFEFLRTNAVCDIVAVMQNYDCLGQEVLKEALDQFVMHQIMETTPKEVK